MRLEERALANEFPAYSDYAARTAQLIPGAGTARTPQERVEVA
jgi:protein-S-isoprenylcysteine O-methyltransferase Ste14